MTRQKMFTFLIVSFALTSCGGPELNTPEQNALEEKLDAVIEDAVGEPVQAVVAEVDTLVADTVA